MKKKVVAVGAIIENEKGEIFATLRSLNSFMGNHWEFPGGKVEEGETHFEAVKREVLEEIDIEVEPYKVYDSNTFEYDEMIVEFYAIKCKYIKGEIKLNVHDAGLWIKKENIESLVWLEADKDLLKRLSKENIIEKEVKQ